MPLCNNNLLDILFREFQIVIKVSLFVWILLYFLVLTWSPLRRSRSVTQTTAARIPAIWVIAANTVASISMFTTPLSDTCFRYAILSFSVYSQMAPSRRPYKYYVIYLKQVRSYIFYATNSNFLIPTSLQLDGLNLWYFKCR